MPASNESQLEYYDEEDGKAIYIFRPEYTSGTFQLQTAHFDDELSMDLSAYKFKPASISSKRELFHFDGRFSKDVLSGVAETVSYTFFVPYYYEGMVIEVEMKGLKFNENALPDDWENWRYLNNDIYAVQYTPTGFLNQVTINLKTDISDIQESCSITVQSKGYETETNSISATQVIPAGRLVVNAARNNAFSSNGTIYLYTTSNYSDTPVGYRYEMSTYTVGRNSYNNGTATNTSEITLTGVNAESIIYLQYVNGTRTWRGSFRLNDALDNNGVNITLTTN